MFHVRLILNRFCYRVLLVFQTGYIHPDEYFQSIEVVAGDVFEVDVTRTWEFNSTSPLRSMVLPTVIFGAPLSALKTANFLLNHYTGLNLISGHLVLLVCRMVMLVLSFSVDYCVYKICVLYKHNYNQCLTTLASSYVMLVYSTRAFSNCLEMFLVSVMIYLVSYSMKQTYETVYLQGLVKESYEKAETVVDRVKIKKKQRLIPEHDFKHFLPISVLAVIGMFNRPTFVAFAFVPLFFWFQRGVRTDSYFSPFQIFNLRMLSMIPGALFTALLFVLLDSLYYGHLTLHKLWHLTMDWSDWKCTPLNFVMYNVVPGNLDKHGTHPIYLHALVNIPLLYGPLGIIAMVRLVFFEP